MVNYRHILFALFTILLTPSVLLAQVAEGTDGGAPGRATTDSLRPERAKEGNAGVGPDTVTAPAEADWVSFRVQPSDSPAGETIEPSVEVQLEEWPGRPVAEPGVPISLTLSSGSGILSGTTTRLTNDQGIATFDDLSVDLVGSKRLKASSEGLLTRTSDRFEITLGPPRRLEIQRQPSGTATAGVPFSRQPEVWVVDGGGNQVTTDNSTLVTAVRLAGEGDLQGTVTVNVRKGFATFENLSHNVAGEMNIVFSSGSLVKDTSAVVRVDPADAARLTFLQQPTNTKAGAVISPPVTVRLRDAFGNDVATTGTAVTISLSSGSGALSGTLTRNTVSGIATFNNLRIDLTGPKKLRAAGGTLTAAVSAEFTVASNDPHAVAFVQQPTNTTAGSRISPAVTVQLRDSLGNDVLRSGVNVSLQISSGNGVLRGTTTRATDSTGFVSFGNLSIDAAGRKVLRASSSGLDSDQSSSFTISPRGEWGLAFVQQPTSARAGQSILPPVTVQLRDSLGNDVEKSGVSVVLALTGGSTGRISGTTTELTDAEGIAAFSNISIDLVGEKRFRATATGLRESVSDSFAITPAPPSRLVFLQGPGASVAGVPFQTQPVVALEDQFENRVTGTPQTVTVSINGFPDSLVKGAATLSVDTSTGLATFAGLLIQRAGDDYALTVRGSTVSTIPGGVLSDAFDVLPASPSRMRVETAADGTGTLLGNQNVSSGTSIVVYSVARDAFDNFVSNAPAAAWALINRTGGVQPTDLVPSADRRSATFIGAVIGSAVIRATATGLSPVSSGTITVVNNAIAVRILVETGANGAGTVVPSQPVVSGDSIVVYAIARDMNNNFVSNVSAGSWSLSAPTGGVAPGDLIPSADRKSAKFRGRRAGSTRILATLGVLNPTSSGVITVVAGEPSAVAATAGSGQTAQVGTAFALRLAARVVDVAGNPVSNIVVTFNAPTSGPSGTFAAGSNTVITNDSGIAMAPVLTANTLAGTFVVTASAVGAGSTASFELTNSSRAVGRLTAIGGTPQFAGVGSPFPARFTVSVQDSFGNPISGTLVTFTAPDTGASGAFTGGGRVSSVPTNADGIGTSPQFTANARAGAYVVTATAPGTESPAEFALANIPGGVASIAPTSGNQQSVEVNTAYPVRLKATVTDGSGNPIRDVPVTFAAPLQGPGGIFAFGDSTVTATDTAGVATAPLFTANTIAGGFIVTARVAGVASPAVFELINEPAAVNAFLLEKDGGGPIGPQTPRVPFAIRATARDRWGNTAVSFAGTVNLSASAVLTQGQGTTPQFVNGVLAGYNVAVQTAGRIVLLALRTGGAEFGVSDTFQVNNPVPTVSGVTPSTGARGQNLSLVVTGSGFLQGVTSVMLGNNITTFETVASDSQITVELSIGQEAAEGPRSVLVINPPPGGGIEIVEGGFVVQGVVYPGTYALSNTIQFPAHAQNSEYQAADYRMVGLPGAPDGLIRQFLTGSQGQDWAVYWDNGDTNDYLVSYDGTSTFNHSPGRAFWLLHRGPLSIDTTVPTAPLDSTTMVRIALHAGWNLICNPFAFAVAWADVESANQSDVLGGVYRFAGSFSLADMLEPYEGYLFDNAGNLPSLGIPLRPARVGKGGASDPATWRVGVELTAGSHVERLAAFGVMADALNGYDPHDLRRPRGVGSLPEVYFTNPERGSEQFATDFRQDVGAIQEWSMSVRAAPRQPVQLSFAGVSDVPAEHSVVLVDLALGRSVDLRAAPVYQYTQSTATSRFRIAVGDEENVRRLIDESLPREFSLGNNYPNPFNPSTIIPVSIPWKSSVTLRVYSVLGELVRTLHAGPLEPGRYPFEWDGAGADGRIVAAGMYVVQLTTDGGQRFASKMLMIK